MSVRSLSNAYLPTAQDFTRAASRNQPPWARARPTVLEASHLQDRARQPLEPAAPLTVTCKSDGVSDGEGG